LLLQVRFVGPLLLVILDVRFARGCGHVSHVLLVLRSHLVVNVIEVHPLLVVESVLLFFGRLLSLLLFHLLNKPVLLQSLIVSLSLFFRQIFTIEDV
jgi:hypothetical protein